MPNDVKCAIKNCRACEDGEIAKGVLDNIIENFEKEYNVYKVNAMDEALKLGNSKVFNIIVLGVAAKHMDFSKDAWLSVIEKTVPPKTVEINKKAFLLGYEN